MACGQRIRQEREKRRMSQAEGKVRQRYLSGLYDFCSRYGKIKYPMRRGAEMKRTIRAVAALFALALSLSLTACGGKADAGPTQSALPDAPGLANAAPSGTSDAAGIELPQAEPEWPAVENNGGFFVRVGDEVWFRHYGGGTFDEPQLWGDFLSPWPSHPSASMLCCRSEADGTITEALPDDGFGPLWFGIDGFYLTRVTDTGVREAYFKALDGTETPLREGVVAGVSENGRYAAVQVDDGGRENTALYLYNGTRELQSVLPYQYAYYEFAAVTDAGALVYSCHEAAAGDIVSTLRQLDADGGETVLGTLPEQEFEFPPIDLRLEQCVLRDGEVYCVFAWYNGTGHFLTRSLCARAALSRPESLCVMELPAWATEDYSEILPQLYDSETDGVTIVQNLPGSLFAAGNSLFRFDAFGESELIAADLLDPPSHPDDEYFIKPIETAGDAAYLMVMSARRAPEEDVGWRMAYTPGELRYLRVPLDGEARVEALFP